MIYADFECLLEKCNEHKSKRARTTFYQKHTTCSVGFYVVPSTGEFLQMEYETYTGADVCK